MVRTGASVALAVFLVATAIVVIPGAQALSVSAPIPLPGPFVSVAVTFDDPDLTALEGLRLHFDCGLSGTFSESIGQQVGSQSTHATVVGVVTGEAAAGYGYPGASAAVTGYGRFQVTQTGYGYSITGGHGYSTGVTGLISTGYGYDVNLGYGYGYNNGYGYGYDSGTLVFVFEMTQEEFEADESCTLVVEVVPVGNPSGDFEGPRSAPFIPRVSPTANAGLDLVRAPGSSVTLDGRLSVDGNDGPVALTYSWRQVGDPTALDLAGTLTARPTFTVPDTLDATLTFELTVFDGLDNDTDEVNVHVGLVQVGPGQEVLEGTMVDLDAIADPDAAIQWSVVSGVPVGFVDDDVANTTFQAPEVDDDTVLVLRLTATHGLLSQQGDVVFTVLDNEAPIALAGPEGLVLVAGTDEVLNADGSHDPDGNPITYQWTKATGPADLVLTGAGTATPTVSVPGATGIQFATLLLTVTDSHGVTGMDTLTIGIHPAGALLANAGPDQDVPEGRVVRLSGDLSTGLIESYQWNPVTAGAPALTQVAGSPYATLTAGLGEFTYKLTVTDLQGNEATDEVTVKVHAAGEWFLHSTGCTLVDVGIPSPATNTADEVDRSGDAECVRLAVPDVGGVVEVDALEFTATAHALPAQAVVGGDLYLSVLAPEGPGSVLPPLDDVDVDLTLMRGATPIGTTHLDADVADLAFGIPGSLPGNGRAYTRLPFSIVTTGALEEGQAFSLVVDVAPTGLAYIIGMEGDRASSFRFPLPPLPAGFPTANAGADRTVDEGSTVVLSGSGADTDAGTIASYQWTQIAGTPVTLVGAATSNPSFTAPAVFADHNLRFRLVVTDNDGKASNPDDVRVTVRDVPFTNRVPLASAGTDVQVPENTNVTLEGAASDPDGDFVQVRWTQPAGPKVGGAASGDQRKFSAPDVEQTTILTFRWTARDNNGGVRTDDVFVTITPVTDGPPAPPTNPPVIILIPDEEPDNDPPPAVPGEDDPDDGGQPDDGTTPPGDDGAMPPPTETDSDGDGVPDRIEIALGTNPNFAGDLPSFDISSTITVRNVGGVNVISWPAVDAALGYQLWSSNSPYTLVATLDADDKSFADPDGKPTTKYKLTYFIEKSRVGGFLTDASQLASLPGWTESSAVTLGVSLPVVQARSPVRALPLWAFATIALLAISIVTLLGVLVLRGRRQT